MFVRSRASRTRAERPIPGDRVLDAFDRALIGAHGAALDLVAAYLSRAGTLEADESGRTLGILAVNSLRRYAATSVRIPCSSVSQRWETANLVSQKHWRRAARESDSFPQGSPCCSRPGCRRGLFFR